MQRAAFVARFGGVYEHSPWVAEAAFDAGLGAAQDTVEGLHGALAAQVAAAHASKKLALLRAHPDLAGRLAVAGELSSESTAEQASARLDQCTAAEFFRFEDLNRRYKEKFGFPFIMAVRGVARLDVLAAFEARIHNDRETELRTALQQVDRIALLRLRDLPRPDGDA